MADTLPAQNQDSNRDDDERRRRKWLFWAKLAGAITFVLRQLWAIYRDLK